MNNRDYLPAPAQGLILTHFLTVRDVARSRDFYADIFGGRVVLEENPAIVKVANSWIIMNPGGGPTPDKPDALIRNHARCMVNAWETNSRAVFLAAGGTASSRSRITVCQRRHRTLSSAVSGLCPGAKS